MPCPAAVQQAVSKTSSIRDSVARWIAGASIRVRERTQTIWFSWSECTVRFRRCLLIVVKANERYYGLAGKRAHALATHGKKLKSYFAHLILRLRVFLRPDTTRSVWHPTD